MKEEARDLSSLLKGRETAIVNQTKNGIVSWVTVGKLLRDAVRAQLSERKAILNRAEQMMMMMTMKRKENGRPVSKHGA